MRGLPHHLTSWEGRGYSSSPKVVSTVGSFHHSITASCSLSAKNSNFPAAAWKPGLKRVFVLSHCPRVQVPAHSMAEQIHHQSAAQAFLVLQAGHSLPSSPAGPYPCVVVVDPHSASSKNHHNVSNKDPSILASSLQIWPRLEVHWERELQTGLTQAAVFPRITSQLPAAST